MPVFACYSCMSAAQAEPGHHERAHQDVDAKRLDFQGETLRRAGDRREAQPSRAISSTSCRNCGAPGQWFKTLRNKSILIELGMFPATEIPPRQRWEITHGDTAAVMQTFPEDGCCRVCHFDVCPQRVAPEGPENARLRQLWKQHGGGAG